MFSVVRLGSLAGEPVLAKLKAFAAVSQKNSESLSTYILSVAKQATADRRATLRSQLRRWRHGGGCGGYASYLPATLLLLACTSADGRCVFTRFLKADASENTALFRVSISILKLRSSLHHQDKVATGIRLEHIGIYSRMEV